MTIRTRRYLLVCFIAVAITLPVESVFLRALGATDAQQAVEQWAAASTPAQLNAAADRIQEYPFRYRRQIMLALTPERRSEVWRNHIRMYIETHPKLDTNALPALEEAIALASPEAFAGPSDSIRTQVSAVASRLVTLIGKEDAQYVLYRLGPRDGQFTSIEPVRERLANMLRRTFVASARADDCGCSQDFGCDGEGSACSNSDGCSPDTTWPMCGWLWGQTCDGQCKSAIKA